MPKAKIKTTHKQIADVAHPDDTPALPTSKPVIVTSRPIMRDPMMAPAAPGNISTVSNKPVATVSHERTIMPPGSEPAVPAIKPAAILTEKADATAEAKTLPDSAVISSSIPDAKETKNSDYSINPDAEIAAEEDEEMAKRAKIDELIETQTYSLPVNATELKKARRFALLGVLAIVILGVAWADISLDAGLIRIDGVKAPTHFFSN